MFRAVGRCAVRLLALACRHRGRAGTAANGNIEGIVRDTTGAALPGVTVTVTNMDTGTARTSVTNETASTAPAPAARPLPRRRRAAGVQDVRAAGHHPLGRPDRAHQRRALGRQRVRNGDGHERIAGRASPGRSISGGRSARTRSGTCRSSRAIPTISRSSRPTSPATRTTSSACRASTPTARRCARTIRSTATPTPRRTAPACACCRCRRCSSAR